MFTSQMPMQTSTSAPRYCHRNSGSPIDEGAEQDVHHRVHEPEDSDPADGIVLHQQGPDDVARAADESQRQQVQHAEHRPVFQPSAQNSAQQEQGRTAHEQVHKADGKAVCPAGDGFVPGACQREKDGSNEHVGYAPGAAAAVVAQRGDENARKADAAAQRLGRGHAVSPAVKEMGEDDPQKALGAVQDAAKGTGEQGNSTVEKRRTALWSATGPMHSIRPGSSLWAWRAACPPAAGCRPVPAHCPA